MEKTGHVESTVWVVVKNTGDYPSDQQYDNIAAFTSESEAKEFALAKARAVSQRHLATANNLSGYGRTFEDHHSFFVEALPVGREVDYLESQRWEVQAGVWVSSDGEPEWRAPSIREFQDGDWSDDTPISDSPARTDPHSTEQP